MTAPILERDIADAAPGLRPATRPVLPQECNGDAAFRHLLTLSAERLHETARAFVSQREPEATHQLRVALRRHRSLLKFFKPFLDEAFLEAQTAAARAVGQRLSPLRELDVLSGETLAGLAAEKRLEAGVPTEAAEVGGPTPPRSKAEAQRARAALKIADAFEALAKKLQSEANRKRTALRRSDLTVEIGELLFDLSKAVAARSWRRGSGAEKCRSAGKRGSKPLKRDARKLAGPAFDRALKKLRAYGDRIDDLSIDERHEMRKKAKTLRYAVGFFGSLYDPEAVKAYRRALKQLQKSFGALNDAADALSLGALEVEPALRPAIKAAIARSEEKMTAEFAVAAERWRSLDDTPRFWR